MFRDATNLLLDIVRDRFSEYTPIAFFLSWARRTKSVSVSLKCVGVPFKMRGRGRLNTRILLFSRNSCHILNYFPEKNIMTLQ